MSKSPQDVAVELDIAAGQFFTEFDHHETWKPYVVSDSEGVPAGGQSKILGDFDTEQEAAEFIGTLPHHLDGRYNLDGPADDYTETDESVAPHLVTDQATADACGCGAPHEVH